MTEIFSVTFEWVAELTQFLSKCLRVGPEFQPAQIITRSFQPFGSSTAVCPSSHCGRELHEYFVIMRDWTEVRLN